MLRGLVTAINGNPTAGMQPRGPEASFLLAGEVPMTFRAELPANSKIVAGEWWPADYAGPPLVSLHESLRNGLGINLGDEVTFTIFGDEIKAKVASFRELFLAGRHRLPRDLLARRDRSLPHDAPCRRDRRDRPRAGRRAHPRRPPSPTSTSSPSAQRSSASPSP